jgi:hypothetical protein
MKFVCPRCQTAFEKFGKDIGYSPRRYGRHDGLGHPVDCPPKWYGSCPTCGCTAVNQEQSSVVVQKQPSNFLKFFFKKVLTNSKVCDTI